MSHRSALLSAPIPTSASSAVVRLAWLNVVLHAVGLLFAAVSLRPGSPLAPEPERTTYLATRPWGWSLGWATWMLCALALVAFLAALAHRLSPVRMSGGLILAVVLAGAGAAVDLSCDTLFIVLLPTLAEDGATPLFLACERALGAGGAVVANGLYSIALLLAVRLSPRGAGWSFPRLLGYATVLAGMSLVAAGFTGVPWHLVATTPLTILLYMAWTVAVARAVSQGESASVTSSTSG